MATEDEVLTVYGFEMSASQLAYQRDAHRQDLGEDEIVFFKDATPKGDHFMGFRVDLPSGVLALLPPGARVPLEVALVALVPGTTGYERVRDQSYLKACVPRSATTTNVPPAPAAGVDLAYRVELGSYRQGDRRFAIEIKVAPKAITQWPVLRAVLPCYTPGVYVASKVKRHRPAEGVVKHEDDVVEPPFKRAAHEDQDFHTADRVAALAAQVERLDRLIVTNVLPALARVEARLAALGVPQHADDLGDLAGPLPPLERFNSEQVISAFYDSASASGVFSTTAAVAAGEDNVTPWADSLNAMGNGIQEGMDAALFNTSSRTTPHNSLQSIAS